MTKKGFTLLELLVVVLMIGILAMLALPQYTRTVEKARLTQAMPTLAAFDRAVQMYLLTEGYPDRGGEDEVILKGEDLLKYLPLEANMVFNPQTSEFCTKDFRFNFYCRTTKWHSSCEMSATRKEGLTKAGQCTGGGYPMYNIFYRYSNAAALKARYCDAYENYTRVYYKGKEGVPTMMCEFAKSAGTVDNVVYHN